MKKLNYYLHYSIYDKDGYFLDEIDENTKAKNLMQAKNKAEKKRKEIQKYYHKNYDDCKNCQVELDEIREA